MQKRICCTLGWYNKENLLQISKQFIPFYLILVLVYDIYLCDGVHCSRISNHHHHTAKYFQRKLFMCASVRACERARKQASEQARKQVNEWLSTILNGFGQSELTSNQRHMKCFQNLNTVRYRFCVYLDRFTSIPIWPMLGFFISYSQSVSQWVSKHRLVGFFFFWCLLSFAFSRSSFFSSSLSLMGHPFIERSAWNSLLHWGSELNVAWEWDIEQKRKKERKIQPNQSSRMNNEQPKQRTNVLKVLNKSRDTRLSKR